MNREGKNRARVKSLVAAVSILLTMNPGIAAYADSAPDSGAAVYSAASAGIGQDTGNSTAESAETSEAENGSAETAATLEEAGSGSAESGETEGTSETSGGSTAESHGTSESGTAETLEPAVTVLESGPEETVGGVLNITGGTSADGDFSYDESTSILTVKTETPLTISNVDNKNAAKVMIFIADGVNAVLILDNATIEPHDGAAISMGESTARVTIFLADGSKNHLYGVNAAGIEKLSKFGRLTVSCMHADEDGHQCDFSCGFLESSCVSEHGAGIGSSGINGGHTGGIYINGGLIVAKGRDGSGIGGSNLTVVSDITINGGRIAAYGDNGSAGIGSPINGKIGTIDINGGIIAAYGSAFKSSGGTCYYGAGIGSGYSGIVDAIRITGGTVYADSSYDSAKGGTGSVGIGAGENSNPYTSVSIIISGGTVAALGGGSSCGIGTTSGNKIPAYIGITGGSVLSTNGSNCTSDIKMSSVPLDNNGNELAELCIPSNGLYDVTINGKLSPVRYTEFYTHIQDAGDSRNEIYAYVPKDGNITVKVGDKTTIYVPTGSGFQKLDGLELEVSATEAGEELIYGTDYSFDPDTKTLSVDSEKGITIKNADPDTMTDNSICVKDGVNANITLAEVNLGSNDDSDYVPIKIADNSKGNVRIILADNTSNSICTNLAPDNNHAALSKNSDSADCGTLTITCEHSGEAWHECGSGCGKFSADGSAGAGIGSDERQHVYNIVIDGGMVNAVSVTGAGIGSGSGQAGTANNITVNGGVVSVRSYRGAGIGSGWGANADGITINGGLIDAVIKQSTDGTTSGAAIGSGANGQSNNLIINDGLIYARGGVGSPALGGWVDRTDGDEVIQINGGLVYLADDKTMDLSPFRSAVTPVNKDGEEVYLLAVSNENSKEITIDGKAQDYRFFSSSDMTFYAYVPAGSNGTIDVMVGDEKSVYGRNGNKFELVGTELIAPYSVYGVDYTYPAATGVLTVMTNNVTISSADPDTPTSDSIVVGADGDPHNVQDMHVFLDKVNIDTSGKGVPAITCSPYFGVYLCPVKDSANYLAADGRNSTISVGYQLEMRCYESGSTNHICSKDCGSIDIKQTGSGNAIEIDNSDSNTVIRVNGGNLTISANEGDAINGHSYGAIILQRGTVTAKSKKGSAIGGSDSIWLMNGIYTLEGGAYYAVYTVNNTSGDVYIDDNASVNISSSSGSGQRYGSAAISKAPVSYDTDGDGNQYDIALLKISNPDENEVYLDGVKLPYTVHSDADKNLYIFTDKSKMHTVKVGSEERQYKYSIDQNAFVEVGRDLVITAVDGSALTLGTDYDYFITTVSDMRNNQVDIGVLTVLTDKAVVIRNADGVDVTQDIIVIQTSNADVTLAGVNIQYPDLFNNGSAFRVAENNSVIITLADGTTNSLVSGSTYGCGIEKNGTGTLIITCEKAKADPSHECDENCGTLSVKSNGYGAGIGTIGILLAGKNAQNININGGNIDAYSKLGAAIGGGKYSGAKNITVSGGVITAKCSSSSAAIGSSEKNVNDDDTITAENIQILGGVVNATGGFGAAAIGSGRGSNASGITIKDAKVRAITDDYAAAIGGGQDANGENITIQNSVVYAESESGAAIIGGGRGGTGSKIYIENSVVSLVQKNSCGYDMIGNGAGDQGDASDIYITGSSVAFISTSPFSSDITQNSPIKDRYSGNEVYLLKIANPDGYDVYADGSTTVAINNSEADPSDTNLYLWLQEGDHSVVLSNLHEQFMTNYHFNYDRIASDPFGAFKLCEADIAEGYRYDETYHWYICAGSETCTTRFNYEKHSGDNATCTDKPTCTACGAVFGNPLGHDFKHYPYVEETCTTDGHLPYYHCVRCDKYFARSDDQLDTPLNTFILKATGHSMTKHAAVVPTCTEKGSKEYYECENCGKLFSDVNGRSETTLADVTIKATGRHTFGNWTIIKEADCTNEGSRQHTCTQCGITETGVIEALGHKYSTEWTIDKAPGCTTSGTKSHHCEICGVKTDMTNIPVAGHKFGDWSVITPATKKQEGLKRRACTVCGETEEKSIPKVPDIAVVIRDPDSSKTDDLPAINGKKKSWDSIRSDILDSTGGSTVKIDVNGSAGIPENVIRALTEKKTAGEFVISDSISIIIDGSKITKVGGGIDFTSTSGNISGLRGKLAGKLGVSQIDFPIGVKISLRPGESGRFANLYGNNGGVRKNIGSAEFGADGSAVISVSEGGELIAMICEFSDVRGDADNDGYVNAKDAAHLLRYVVGMCQMNNSEMADFNLDGTVDARDAAAILRMVVGL